jgi:hypothetical protein
MKTLLILVLGILALAGVLRWLAAKGAARQSPNPRPTAPPRATSHNPYLDYSFEGSFFPILNDPETPRRIEECVYGLRSARERLATEFGLRVFAGDRMESGHNTQFLKDWRSVCEVARAKYGDVIFDKALKLTGYHVPSSIEINHGDLW